MTTRTGVETAIRACFDVIADMLPVTFPVADMVRGALDAVSYSYDSKYGTLARELFADALWDIAERHAEIVQFASADTARQRTIGVLAIMWGRPEYKSERERCEAMAVRMADRR